MCSSPARCNSANAGSRRSTQRCNFCPAPCNARVPGSPRSSCSRWPAARTRRRRRCSGRPCGSLRSSRSPSPAPRCTSRKPRSTNRSFCTCRAPRSSPASRHTRRPSACSAPRPCIPHCDGSRARRWRRTGPLAPCIAHATRTSACSAERGALHSSGRARASQIALPHGVGECRMSLRSSRRSYPKRMDPRCRRVPNLPRAGQKATWPPPSQNTRDQLLAVEPHVALNEKRVT